MSEMLPLFPLSTVLFPGMRLPLHVFEERYRVLVADLLARPEPRRFGVITIRKGSEVGADGVTALHEAGCVAAVRQIVSHPDGRFDLAIVGTERFRLIRLDRSPPYLTGEIEPLPDEPSADEAGPGTAQAVALAQAAFRGYLNALADRGGGVISVADLPDEPVLLSYVIGAAMIIDLPERQSLLAAPDAASRLRLERSLLVREAAMFRATTSRPAPDYSFEQFSQNLAVDDDAADVPAGHHVLVARVDLVKGVPRGDQLGQLELAGAVQVEEPRYVLERVGRAEQRALQPLLEQRQLEP
jgi:Lon protease-like protein